MIYNFDALSFQIVTVDRFFHQEGFYEVKARPFAALSLRTAGTGSFEIGTRRLMTAPGDVLFLPANTPYKVEYSVSESIVIHFDQCNYTEAESIRLANSLPIGRCFTHLLQVWREPRSVNQAKSVIYDILDKIASDQRAAITDTAVARCVRYMEEHYNDPGLDVAALCEVAFISVSSLQRAFTKSLAMSPKQYLICLRLQRALALLTQPVLSVKEVSFACGFTDEKYFSRAFKKRYGYPPSQLRSNMMV